MRKRVESLIRRNEESYEKMDESFEEKMKKKNWGHFKETWELFWENSGSFETKWGKSDGKWGKEDKLWKTDKGYVENWGNKLRKIGFGYESEWMPLRPICSGGSQLQWRKQTEGRPVVAGGSIIRQKKSHKSHSNVVAKPDTVFRLLTCSRLLVARASLPLVQRTGSKEQVNEKPVWFHSFITFVFSLALLALCYTINLQNSPSMFKCDINFTNSWKGVTLVLTKLFDGHAICLFLL